MPISSITASPQRHGTVLSRVFVRFSVSAGLSLAAGCADTSGQRPAESAIQSTASSTSGGDTNSETTSNVTAGAGGSGGGDLLTGSETASNVTTGAGGSGGANLLTDCELPAIGEPGQKKPSGAVSTLQVLDWAGYQAAVSYTFDDSNSSQISHYDELNALGVPLTFYLQTNKGEASNEIWAQALLDGHELGNHSHTHQQTGTEADVDTAQEFIQKHFGVRAYTMAAPYGDSSYQAIAQTRFMINRGVSNALILPNGNTNPFNLPCYIPPEGASADTINAQVNSAASGGGWRTFLVHGFTGGSDGAYQPVDIAEFVSAVEYAKSLETVWIDTVETVGAYWIGQKLITSATPTTDADSSTWSWTLPDNFPPGKCVRITVEGGTVSQGGTAIDWDEHGYYEIKLDAGSVTVAP